MGEFREGAKKSFEEGRNSGSDKKGKANPDNSEKKPLGKDSKPTEFNLKPSQPQQEPDNVLNVNETDNNNKNKSFTVEDIVNDENLSDTEKEMEIDNINDPLEQQKAREQINKSKGKPTAGINKEDDPDEEKADEDKFEIKTGDFIDFLMKDVVLEFAQYVGKKTSGMMNYAIYKGASLVWHGAKDHLIDPTLEGIEDAYEARKKRRQERQENNGEYLVPLDDIKAAPNKETEELLRNHNSNIKKVQNKDKSGIALANMAKELLTTGELKNCSKSIWVDNETGLEINIEKEEHAQAIIKMSQQLRKNAEIMELPPQQQEKLFSSIGTSLALKIDKATELQTQMLTFANNMATAQVLQDITSENPNSKSHEVYLSEYMAMFNTFRKKLESKEKIPEGVKSLDDLVGLSKKALKDGYKNQNESVHTNKTLLKLNNAITQKDIKDNTPTTLYMAATATSLLQEELDKSNKLVSSYEAAKSQHESDKNKKKNNNKEKGDIPQRQQTERTDR